MAKFSKEITERICDLIKKDSYTVAEICKMVNINLDTYYDWIKNKPEFSDAVKKAREEFDQFIVNEAKKSLLKMVQGYEVEEKKTVYTEGKDGKPKIKEQTTTKKHFQPNVAATIFLLTNKASDEYKNRQNTEITGKDGKDLVSEIKVEIIDRREDVENSNN